MSDVRSNFSRPGAWRFWDYLMSRGGRATSMEVVRDTHVVGARDGANDLRCLLQTDHGYSREEANAAVSCTYRGRTPSGAKIMVYALREDVRDLHRELREETPDSEGACPELAERGPAPADPAPEATTAAVSFGEAAQKMLFDMTGGAAARRQH